MVRRESLGIAPPAGDVARQNLKILRELTRRNVIAWVIAPYVRPRLATFSQFERAIGPRPTSVGRYRSDRTRIDQVADSVVGLEPPPPTGPAEESPCA